MLKNIKQNVVIFCLLHFSLCVYASEEYIYSEVPAEIAKVEDNFDQAGIAAGDSLNLAVIAAGDKKASNVGTDPSGDKGGGNQASMALSSHQSGESNDIQLESSSSITGLSVHTQYIIIAVVCSVVALVGILIAVSCWCRLHSKAKADINSSAGNYSGYGVTGPTSNTLYFHDSGDRKLAQSAQMYHYQHQKQQMIDMEKANGDTRTDATDEESEAENDNDTYTVFEAPGLAQSGDIEVHNPLFKAPAEDTNGNVKVEKE